MFSQTLRWVRLLVLPCCLAEFQAGGPPAFELVRSLDQPVIGASLAKDKYHINNGFEGGYYMRTEDGMYHLFPSECMQDMKGVAWDIHMESHHWTSPDGISNWTRGAMVYNSSAKRDGSDRRGAIWAPMMVFNQEEGHWNLFYVGYTCNPGQVDGAIYRIVSQTPGKVGIDGPYPAENATIILDMEGVGGKAEQWEGGNRKQDQGDDSFFAWQLDNGTWVGFMGTHVRDIPAGEQKTWKVGLVMAHELAGPWTRMGWLNPADYIEKPEGIENPIVIRTTDKRYYVAVFDALMRDQIHGHSDVVGISYSSDGVHWMPAQYVSLNATASGCGGTVRTPQGLVPEPKMCAGCYSMLYTGIDGSYRNECWVLLRNKAEMEPTTSDRQREQAWFI